MSGPVLTVADVAKLRRVGRVAAYRWLKRNASAYLQRRGRFVVIAASHFEKLAQRPVDERVLDRFARLEERIAEGERRLDVHAQALKQIHLL